MEKPMLLIKKLSYNSGKVNLDSVTIPDAESAFLLTDIIRKLERMNTNFDFELNEVEIENKEDADKFIKSMSRFSINMPYESLIIYPNSNEFSESEPEENAFSEDTPVSEDIPVSDTHNPFND
jgi:hypothetical protein